MTTTTGCYSLFVLALLFAYLSVIMACTGCSSLANNDNLPQGNGPLLLLYKGEDFNEGPVGIPAGYVSVDFAIAIRSLKCPPGYEVILYDQPENMGAYVILSGDVASLEAYHFSGRMRSLRYIRKDQDQNQLIHPQIFEKSRFEGEQKFLPFGLTELPEPKYVGSLKIPVGVTVRLSTIYGPRFSTRDIVLTSDSDELPFTDPVKAVFVSVNLVEL
jgi:hypothetical protein